MALEELLVIYDKYREGCLDGTVDFDADTYVAKAMDATYVPSATTHEYLDDIDPAAIIATSAALSGKSATDGIAKAADASITIPLGETCVGILIVDTTIDPGNGGRLACYIGKDNEGNPLDIDGTGDPVTFRFGAGTNRIFSV